MSSFSLQQNWTGCYVRALPLHLELWCMANLPSLNCAWTTADTSYHLGCSRNKYWMDVHSCKRSSLLSHCLDQNLMRHRLRLDENSCHRSSQPLVSRQPDRQTSWNQRISTHTLLAFFQSLFLHFASYKCRGRCLVDTGTSLRLLPSNVDHC